MRKIQIKDDQKNQKWKTTKKGSKQKKIINNNEDNQKIKNGRRPKN